jgi:hypothetical protein
MPASIHRFSARGSLAVQGEEEARCACCFTKYRRKIFDAAALDWLAGHAQQVLARIDCRLLASDYL